MTVRLFETHRLRRRESLDGLWDFAADREDQSEKQKWQRKFPADCGRMAVPGCWDTLAKHYDYHGKGWYRRRIYVPAACHLQLSFDGVGGAATVWLDGKVLGRNNLVAMPFDFLRRNVRAGEHEIVVEVDNSKTRQDIFPNYGCDWFHYGGITRSAEAAFLGDTRVRELRAHYTIEGGRVKLAPAVLVENLGRSGRVEEIALELNGEEVARQVIFLDAGEVATVEMELPPKALALWSPESPKLHLLRAVCGGDDLAERTGFRAVTLRKGRICINGRPMKLLGVNRHEDYGDNGWAIPPDILNRDFQIIRDLGANALRCHYPITALGMDLCDEMGLLVWEEIPFYARWAAVVDRPDYLAMAEQALEAMVRRDRNRPSVFVWSVLNECATSIPAGARAAARLVKKTRALDPTRLVSYASNQLLKDRGFRLLDIVGLNSYPGWYDEKRFTPWSETIPAIRRKLRSEGKGDCPILVTETGAAGLYGDRSFEDRKWSEQFQERVLAENLEYLLSDEDVAGVFIWQFADLRTIREYWSNRPGTLNNKGLLDRFRRPKDSYWKVREIYRRFGGQDKKAGEKT